MLNLIKKYCSFYAPIGYAAICIALVALAWRVVALEQRMDAYVDVQNHDAAFLAGKLLDYEDTTDVLLQHVGLQRIDDGSIEQLERFDLDCIVADDSMSPPRLACDREWQPNEEDERAH